MIGGQNLGDHNRHVADAQAASGVVPTLESTP